MRNQRNFESLLLTIQILGKDKHVKSTLYRRGSDGKHAVIIEHIDGVRPIPQPAVQPAPIDEYDLIFETGNHQLPEVAGGPSATVQSIGGLSLKSDSLAISLAKVKDKVLAAKSLIPDGPMVKSEVDQPVVLDLVGDLGEKVDTTPTKKRAKKPRGPVRKALLGLELIVAAYAIFYLCLAVWTANSIQTTSARPHHHRADTAGENWLLVGSDSRKGLSFQDMKALHTGMDHSSQRTDTIMVVHFGGTGPATLVSLPRDSYVVIPMHKNNGKVIPSYRDKINSAFAIRPSLLVSTVEYNTGLHIDHYMQVGFGGIRDLTDALSGVRMCVPQHYVDIKSGLDVDKGCQVLDGKTALAYVRMRYVDPRGDIGRIERQQQYLGAVLNKVTSPGTFLNPFAMIALSQATTKSLTLGHGDSLTDLGKLGLAMGKIMSGDGTVRTVPVSSTNAVTSVGSSVLWNEKYAKALFRKLGAR